ncbi:MAG: hypothetical protein WCP19_08830 [Chloroflexota bacterium]
MIFPLSCLNGYCQAWSQAGYSTWIVEALNTCAPVSLTIILDKTEFL